MKETDRRGIYEKIEAGEYAPKAAYPAKPHRPKFPSTAATSSEFAAHSKKLLEFEAEIAVYNEQLQKYSEELAERGANFQRDLVLHIGIPESHPKASILYAMAYDRGHSSGMASVVQEAEELVKLISE